MGYQSEDLEEDFTAGLDPAEMIARGSAPPAYEIPEDDTHVPAIEEPAPVQAGLESDDDDLFAPPSEIELKIAKRHVAVEDDLFAPPTQSELRSVGAAPPLDVSSLNDPIKDGMTRAYSKMMEGLPASIDFTQESSPLTESYFPKASEINAKPVATVGGVNIPSGQAVMESILAGIQMSAIQLAVKGGQKPEYALPEDAGAVLNVANQMSTLAADMPVMAAGGAGGTVLGAAAGAGLAAIAIGPGLPVAAGALILGTVGARMGAFALPAFLRKGLMDHFEKGGTDSFSEFWDRFSAATLDGFHEGLIGLATLGAEKAIPGVGKLLRNKALVRGTGLSVKALTMGQGLATNPNLLRVASLLERPLTARLGEVATMVSAGKLLNGQLNDMKATDFTNAAAVLQAMHFSTAISSRMLGTSKSVAEVQKDKISSGVRKLFRREGILPRDSIEIGREEPMFTQELIEGGDQTPRTIKPMTAENDPRTTAERPSLVAKKELSTFEANTRKARERLEGHEIAQDPEHHARLEQELSNAEINEDLARSRYETSLRKELKDAELDADKVIKEKDKRAIYRGEAKQELAKAEKAHQQAQELYDIEKVKDRPNEERLRALDETLMTRERELQLAEEEFGQHSELEFQHEASKPKFIDEQSHPALLEKNDLSIENEDNVGLKVEPPARASRLFEILASERGSLFKNAVIRKPETAQEIVENRIDNRMAYREGRPGLLGKLRNTTWEEIYENAVDKFDGFYRITKDLTLATGRGLETAQDPYKLARLAVAYVGKGDHFLNHGALAYHTLGVVSPALKEILQPHKAEMRDLNRYLVSLRTIELHKRGPDPETGRPIHTGIDIEDARFIVANAKGKFDKATEQLQDYQNNLLNYLLDGGLISKEARDKIIENNKHYAPLYRLLQDGTTQQKGGTRGQQESGARLKRIKGIELEDDFFSTSRIVDPIQSIVNNTFEYIRLAENNRALVALKDLAESHPLGKELLREVKDPLRATEVQPEEYVKALKDQGLEVNDLTLEAFKVFRSFKAPLGKNQIAIWENGNRRVFEVDPAVKRSYEALTESPKAMGIAMKIATLPAKTLRGSLSFTPDFIVRNFFRDQITAAQFTKYKDVPFIESMFGVGSALKEMGWTQGEAYQEMLKAGGMASILKEIDQDYIERNIWELNRKTGFMANAANVIKNPLEAVRLGAAFAHHISGTIENATRLEEFQRVRKDKGSLFDAAFSAREITVDFQRMGAATSAWNAVTAFMNVNIQGLDRFARSFQGNGAMGVFNQTLHVGARITVPSVALWAWNNADPDRKKVYQGLQNWQKNLFWNFVIHPSLPILRVPKPFEAGVLFGSLPERALDTFFGNQPDAFDDFASTVFSAFTPPVIPTAVTPVLEHLTNKSFFTHRPLISSRYEHIKPAYQYRPQTTEVAKNLGKALRAVGLGDLGWDKGPKLDSPEVIEHYVRNWGGNLGLYALRAVDNIAGVNKNLPEKPWTDSPFVRAFFFQNPSLDHRSIDNFYKNYDITQTQRATAKSLEGDKAAYAKELSDPLNRANMTSLETYADTLSKHREMIRKITDSKKLDPHEKRLRIEQATAAMIVVAQRGNEKIESIRKRAKK